MAVIDMFSEASGDLLEAFLYFTFLSKSYIILIVNLIIKCG